jgi:glutamate/tyrosine decarboxylase-like PLP-dependent enzyme
MFNNALRVILSMVTLTACNRTHKQLLADSLHVIIRRSVTTVVTGGGESIVAATPLAREAWESNSGGDFPAKSG